MSRGRSLLAPRKLHLECRSLLPLFFLKRGSSGLRVQNKSNSRPLESINYEMQILQVLSFDIHPNWWGVGVTRHGPTQAHPERLAKVTGGLGPVGRCLSEPDPGCQLTLGGKMIFQNCGAGERNSMGRSDPS